VDRPATSPRAPPGLTVPHRPEDGPVPQARGGLLAVVFVLLAAAILALGHQVEQQNLRSLQQQQEAALRAVATSKASAVTAWLDAQRRWVSAAASMHFITEDLPKALAGDAVARQHLAADLAVLLEGMELEAILLVDAEGSVLFSAGGHVEPAVLAGALRAASSPRTGITRQAGGMGTDGLWTFAQRLGEHPAFLVTLVDPAPSLGHLLDHWPLPDSDGVTVLASFDPDGEITLLPGLGTAELGTGILDLPGKALGLDGNAARREASGIFLVSLPDRQPMMMALARVSGANWVVASMLEQDPRFAGAPFLAGGTALVVLLAIAVAAWLILALFRQQQALNRALVDKVVHERDLLDQHFSYLTRFANDIVLLMDGAGRIVNCNDRALSAYGYAREELLGRNVTALRPPGLVAAGQRQLSTARTEGSLVAETWHRRRDGSQFPVEESVRSFMVDGEPYLQSILRDITERKHAEEELKAGELRFRNIFEHTGVGMGHVSPKGRILMVNRRFAELLGYSTAELEGRWLEQLTMPEDTARELGLFRELATGARDDYTLQKRYRRSDDSVLWAQLTATSMRDEHGRVQYLVHVIEDIGARKHLEAQLRRRTRLYRALSETNRLIARAADLDELLSRACKVAAAQADLPLVAVARYRPHQPEGQILATAGTESLALAEEFLELRGHGGVFPPALGADANIETLIVNDVEAGPISSATRVACLRFGIRSLASFALGAGAGIEARLAVFAREPRLLEGETLELFTDMARDLSLAVDRFGERQRRERAEQRLQEVARRMTTLIDAAPVPVFDLDAEGRVLSLWNPAAAQLFGWRRDELIGRRLPIVPEGPDGQGQFDGLRARTLAGAPQSGCEVRYLCRDGSAVYLSLATAPIAGVEGEPAMLVVAEDITARHAAAEALRAARDALEERVRERTRELEVARDKAEEADRIKTAFLANMSQELRTPLNSIIGFSSLLLSGGPGAINDEQGKQLGLIRGAGERLLSLIDDILDISRLQAEDAQLHREPTPLRDMLLRVVDGVRPQAASRRLQLTTDIESCVAMAEPRRLEQVLSRLLSNAVEYTEQGSVTVRCRQDEDSVYIAVEDTGIGINASDQQRLFRPFEALQKRAAGQGLGLAISRRLVEAMNGEITVESEPGRGSTFTVRLAAAEGR
jgi:PAS domain S-box-containing protein